MSPRTQLYIHYGLRGLGCGTVTGLCIAAVVAVLLRARRRSAEPKPCPLCEPGGWL